MKFHNISNLESMMIQIQECGEEEMFNYFDSIKNPIERAKERALYFKAIKKLEETK
jgi:hypothetical protein